MVQRQSQPILDVLTRPAPEAVHGFMRHWHGREPAEHALPAGVRLPAVLREFHRRYGTAAGAWHVSHLQPPEEVWADEEDDRFLVFSAEEQFVYLWAIAAEDLDAADPPVWCRENLPGAAWVQDAPSVSVFLVQMLVMNAALSGPHAAVASWLAPEAVDRALSALAVLDLPPWHWPGPPARWYAGADAVAFAGPNLGADAGEEPALSVWVSARSPDGLRFLEPHLTDDWDHYSPRDG
jgi:hypothetical protein